MLTLVSIALALFACKKAPEGSADEIGVKECDEYVVKYEACLGKMAPEAKTQALCEALPDCRLASSHHADEHDVALT